MESLRQIRTIKNKTQKDIAEVLGISRPMYSAYEQGRFQLSNDKLELLAEYYDVPLDVISGKVDIKNTFKNIETVEKETVTIPIVGHIRAGYDAIAQQNIEGYMEIEESISKRFPGCFALNVYGNSMEPEIHNGDKVIVQPTTNVKSGDVAIVSLNGDEATIKRVQIDENGITIIPRNPKYKSITYTPEQVEGLPVTICGRVIQVRHDYF